MAYDKVVDSTVLNAGLTAIANAIREKGGTSGTLAFPDGMAEAIAAIEAGGGNFVTGTFTTTDDISSDIVITHNLGVKPHFIAVVSLAAAPYNLQETECLGFVYHVMGGGNTPRYRCMFRLPNSDQVSHESFLVSSSESRYRFHLSETTYTLAQSDISSTVGIGATKDFFWIAYGG